MLSTSIKSALKDLGDPYFWARSQNELARLLDRFPGNSPADILAIAKGYRGQGWYKRLSAYQLDDEFRRLIEWAVSVKPRIVLEIGTAQGASLLAWCRIASDLVVSVDLPGGRHGGGYVPKKQRLYRCLGRGRPVNIELLQADSHSPKTKADVEGILGGKKLDILFIDGDHTYAGVSHDFALWSPLVSSGGYVVFHDIVPHRHVADCEVDRLWRELKVRHRTEEIVAASDEGWGGIGILAMP